MKNGRGNKRDKSALKGDKVEGGGDSEFGEGSAWAYDGADAVDCRRKKEKREKQGECGTQGSDGSAKGGVPEWRGTYAVR